MSPDKPNIVWIDSAKIYRPAAVRAYVHRHAGEPWLGRAPGERRWLAGVAIATALAAGLVAAVVWGVG